MKSNTAAKLYLDIQNGGDIGLIMLNVLKSTKEVDIDVLLTEYRSLVSGDRKVAKITTSKELSDNQKESIKNKVSALFKSLDLLFAFTVDKSVEGGIDIQVGDDKIDF